MPFFGYKGAASKNGLLIEKQTSYGRHVSLNLQRKADIDGIIKDILGS
jgi:hypothetical protein